MPCCGLVPAPLQLRPSLCASAPQPASPTTSALLWARSCLLSWGSPSGALICRLGVLVGNAFGASEATAPPRPPGSQLLSEELARREDLLVSSALLPPTCCPQLSTRRPRGHRTRGRRASRPPAGRGPPSAVTSTAASISASRSDASGPGRHRSSGRGSASPR